MDLTLAEEIQQTFCPDGRQPIVAIDVEDIETMIDNGEDVRLVTLGADSVTALVARLKTDPLLPSARKIAFELIVARGYEFPFSDIAPLSDCLASLPNHPEILWGCSRASQQTRKLRLNILTTSYSH